jgi:predicted KAP-like P-loop ATPase
MLQLIKKEIEDDDKYIIIDFDAWLFQNYDDARASLMEVISRQLIKSAEEDKDLFDKAKGLLKRVNYLRAIGTTIEIGASLALGIPPLGFFKRGVDAVGDIFTNSGDTEHSFQEVKGAIKEGTDFAKGLVKEDENTPPQQITAFREHFAEVLQGLNKTLVIFIDNLDRCLPSVAIETLEAIRLFLFLDNTAFIIAADEEMIRGSVRSHYDGIDEKHITDYLDKLIQVPIRVPLLGVPEVQAYTSLLFTAADPEGIKVLDQVRAYSCDQIMNSWNDAKLEAAKIVTKFDIQSASLKSSLDLAERLAPILTSAPKISGNPRIIKRLLNTVRIRCKLAKRRKMPVDEALLTKFAIFERCTPDTSYVRFPPKFGPLVKVESASLNR